MGVKICGCLVYVALFFAILLLVSKNIETEFGNSTGSGFSLGDIPYHFRTEKVCREALAIDKRAKSAIPEKYKYLIE